LCQIIPEKKKNETNNRRLIETTYFAGMIRLIVPFFCLLPFLCFGQKDTSDIEALGKETVLSEVVIRSGFDVNKFLQRIKNDTTFYKAFRTLHILGW